MCSFTITNKDISLESTNHFSQKRGPDSTSVKKINGISFLHNLLHLTGDKVHQPIIEDDLVCVLNGEIYNYQQFGNFDSDVQCIIPLYKEFGFEFAKKLDGEFSICMVDFKKSRLMLFNDTFATKPLWFAGQENDWGVASYESSLKSAGFELPQKVIGNYAWMFDLQNLDEIGGYTIKEFHLNQHKDSYEDWIKAFESSIQKRVSNTNKGIFLGLSAGYDSGAITCELLNQGVDFKAYTIMSNENEDIVEQRHSMLENGEMIYLGVNEYYGVAGYLEDNCEDFFYKDRYKNYDIKEDKASMGLGAICGRANQNNERIYLSGQGADEIISDYGFNGNKIYNHSSFGGLFPKDLNDIFPWHSFYDGTQIQYLNKEEYVAGAYGIETRYPFLDTQLVQEFLWLSSDLKNKKYKAPIAEYLEKYNFPFEEGKKTGFQAGSNLV